MKRLLISFLLLLLPIPVMASVNKDCVILLHGLARTKASMNKMSKELEKHFDVTNDGYPSTEKTIEVLSKEYLPAMLKKCDDFKQIHFVTHSMGGILLRQYLSTNTIPNLGNIVMLSPPNQGSEVVDKLSWLPPFEWLNGPAGKQLGTDKNSVPIKLPDADYPLAIITGNKSINLILSQLIPGEDDGKVSVERAKLAGMKEFLVMPHTHPFIMDSDIVIQHTIQSLRYGSF